MLFCLGFNKEPGKEEVNPEDNLLNCCMIGHLNIVLDGRHVHICNSKYFVSHLCLP